jgi:hypothetical protein
MNKSFTVINGEIFHHKLQIEFSSFSETRESFFSWEKGLMTEEKGGFGALKVLKHKK